MYKLILVLFLIILFIELVMLTISKSDKKNELSEDNVEETNNININEKSATVERIIPDNVHANNPTTESTQDVDCKKYQVEDNAENLVNVEKITIGSNENNKQENETTISSDDPIKEKENPILKLFTSKDEV